MTNEKAHGNAYRMIALRSEMVKFAITLIKERTRYTRGTQEYKDLTAVIDSVDILSDNHKRLGEIIQRHISNM